MSIVSFNFFLFIAGVVVLYYILPVKARWSVILIANIGFFLLSSTWKLLLVALIPTLVTYIMAIIIDNLQAKKSREGLITLCKVDRKSIV